MLSEDHVSNSIRTRGQISYTDFWTAFSDRLNIPFDPIPHELYWAPDERAPGLSDINCAVIPAGKAKTITYVVNAHEPTYIVVNRWAWTSSAVDSHEICRSRRSSAEHRTSKYTPIGAIFLLIIVLCHRFCDRTFGMGIWHHENMAAVDFTLDEMNGEWTYKERSVWLKIEGELISQAIGPVEPNIRVIQGEALWDTHWEVLLNT